MKGYCNGVPLTSCERWSYEEYKYDKERLEIENAIERYTNV